MQLITPSCSCHIIMLHIYLQFDEACFIVAKLKVTIISNSNSDFDDDDGRGHRLECHDIAATGPVLFSTINLRMPVKEGGGGGPVLGALQLSCRSCELPCLRICKATCMGEWPKTVSGCGVSSYNE